MKSFYLHSFTLEGSFALLIISFSTLWQWDAVKLFRTSWNRDGVFEQKPCMWIPLSLGEVGSRSTHWSSDISDQTGLFCIREVTIGVFHPVLQTKEHWKSYAWASSEPDFWTKWDQINSNFLHVLSQRRETCQKPRLFQLTGFWRLCWIHNTDILHWRGGGLPSCSKSNLCH